MNKKYLIVFLIALVLISGGYYVYGRYSKDNSQPSQSQCKVDKIKYYYQNGCSWCKKVKEEGTIEKIEQLGIEVEEINAAVGPVGDKISGTPSFVIGGTVYSGYRTFEDLKKLLGCPLEADNVPDLEDKKPLNEQANNNQEVKQDNFKGEKGTELILKKGKVQLNTITLDDGIAKFYNVKMPNEKVVYFFAVKDQFGTYRAAANGCEVCYGERKGFRQEGSQMVCNNCGNAYPLEKIATEKGGCNPGPINPNLKVVSGKITLTQAELEQVADLF